MKKFLITSFLILLILGSAAGFFVYYQVTSTPEFSKMKSAIEVTIYLPNKTTSTRMVGPNTADWVPISEVSDYLLSAVISSEDAAFYSHQGVDVHELKESIKKDWNEKRWARGGSTITQQVIKNTFLTREKSVSRKVKEIILAQKMEKALTKTQILNFYVNLVEWGPGIYGIRKASQHYFQTNPASLTPKQSAFLAMLLPSPVKYYSYFKKKELTLWAKRRVGQILRVMNRMGHIGDEQYKVALNESLWGEKDYIFDADLEKAIGIDDESLTEATTETPIPSLKPEKTVTTIPNVKMGTPAPTKTPEEDEALAPDALPTEISDGVE